MSLFLAPIHPRVCGEQDRDQYSRMAEDRPSPGGGRGGLGACGPEPCRGGLCPLRPVRAPACPDGRLGALPGPGDRLPGASQGESQAPSSREREKGAAAVMGGRGEFPPVGGSKGPEPLASPNVLHWVGWLPGTTRCGAGPAVPASHGATGEAQPRFTLSHQTREIRVVPLLEFLSSSRGD